LYGIFTTILAISTYESYWGITILYLQNSNKPAEKPDISPAP
jgi:hypothetical protein